MKKTLLLALAAIGSLASAQFTQGNLVVRVVGDGGATTGNQPTSLREFTTAGAQVGGDLLLTNLPGSRNVTNVYGESSEGALDLSGDGRYLMVGGYDLAARDASFDVFNSPRPARSVSRRRSFPLSATACAESGLRTATSTGSAVATSAS
jgi:hypothetical protein